jgi:intracellular septation protein
MMKLVEDFGPLFVFLILNSKGAEWLSMDPSQSLFIATGGFMMALLIAIGFTYIRGKKPHKMTLISAGFVLVFGGLTLFLQDEMFIKMKPTIVYCLFAGILWVGEFRGTSYLEKLMGSVMPLTDEGWKLLSRRWIYFFAGMAVLNEVLWRNLSTDQWVQFKVFGFMALTILFVIAQMPLYKKFHVEKAK